MRIVKSITFSILGNLETKKNGGGIADLNQLFGE